MKDYPSFSITYSDLNRSIPVKNSDYTILQHSISNKIPHLHECGGHGLCTTCRIRILDGASHVSPPTKQELALRKQRNWDPGIRLGCQTRVKDGDVTLERIIWTNAEISNLQMEIIPYGIGEEKELAILFCDMRNFTPLAGKHSNFDLAHMLNRFFTEMGDPIYMNNGVIYQYAGDEIIALFGTEGGDAETICLQAVRAALGMQYAIDRLNKWDLAQFDAQVSIGIGLHYGHAFVGNVGHPRHKQFAVIGDTVNITSRIQAQNKELNTKILASKAFHKNIADSMLPEALKAEVSLKGKEDLFELHEIIGFSDSDIHLEVQRTINELLKNEEEFAAEFYSRLFVRAPEIRKLFVHDMMDQGKLLTHMLRGIVFSLSRPQHLHLGLKSLGEQHISYGVKSEHYPIVKEVLLETIYNHLGKNLTPNTRIAWDGAMQLIIDGMT